MELHSRVETLNIAIVCERRKHNETSGLPFDARGENRSLRGAGSSELDEALVPPLPRLSWRSQNPNYRNHGKLCGVGWQVHRVMSI